MIEEQILKKLATIIFDFIVSTLDSFIWFIISHSITIFKFLKKHWMMVSVSINFLLILSLTLYLLLYDYTIQPYIAENLEEDFNYINTELEKHSKLIEGLEKQPDISKFLDTLKMFLNRN